MPGFTQDNRKLRIATPLGPNDLFLVGIDGREAMSELFVFELDLLAENTTVVPFDSLLGQSITAKVELREGGFRFMNGICIQISEGERSTLEDSNKTFTSFKMQIVPKAWRLTRKHDSRTFQQKSLSEIVQEVLGEHSVTFQWNASGTFEKRDYCVQYRETDWNFLSRILEEEGVYYYFTHSDGSHTLVFDNIPDNYPDVPGPTTIKHEKLEGGEQEEERVQTWRKWQRLRSGKVTLWDYTFEMPTRNLEATKDVLPNVQVGSVSHSLALASNSQMELYDFPGGWAKRFDGVTPTGGDQASELQKNFRENTRSALIQMQQEDLQNILIEGVSNVPFLVAGHKFTLSDHWQDNDVFVVTSIRHTARETASFRSGGAEAFSYKNDFTCIPKALKFRPLPVTPKPVVHGLQSAVVVGPQGEEIFTDKYGRVKVQFRWDRKGQKNPQSSCWVRVGTTWAGGTWGAIRIPRIGQEVLVAFEEGDPDQPVIVGSVYNADNMPPYTLPDERTKSTVKSRSTLQGQSSEFNEIRFEDKKGSEEILIHAEKDMTVEVENSRTTTVGITPKCQQSSGGDDKLTVWNNRDVTIGVAPGIGNDTLTVKNDRSATIGMGANNDKLTVNGQRQATISISDKLDVGTTLTVTTGQGTSVKAGATIELQAGASITIQAGGAVTVEAAGAVSVTSAASVSVTAPTIAINGVTAINGATTINGALAVNGAAAMNGAVAISGATAVNGLCSLLGGGAFTGAFALTGVIQSTTTGIPYA